MRPSTTAAVTDMATTGDALLVESVVRTSVAIRDPGTVGTVMMSPAVGMLHSSHSAYRAGRHSSTLDPAGIVLVTPLTGACVTASLCGLTTAKSSNSASPKNAASPTAPSSTVSSVSSYVSQLVGSVLPSGHTLSEI